MLVGLPRYSSTLFFSIESGTLEETGRVELEEIGEEDAGVFEVVEEAGAAVAHETSVPTKANEAKTKRFFFIRFSLF